MYAIRSYYADRFLKLNRVENGLSDYGHMIEPAANYLFQIEDIRNWNDKPARPKAQISAKKTAVASRHQAKKKRNNFV